MAENNPLGNFSGWVMGFVSLGIFAAVASVVLSSIQSGVTACVLANATLNTSVHACYDAANNSVLSPTTAQYNVSGLALDGISNVTSQFGTAGTLVGLSVLALAAVLVVGYFYRGKSE